MKRIVFAIAVAVLSATPALAQYQQTQPYQTQEQPDPSAQVRMGGGLCEGAYDVKAGTNFGMCRSSAAKSSLGAQPESGGDSGSSSSAASE